jgi:tetrahydromethanopterin S-methyltransferase subunit A
MHTENLGIERVIKKTTSNPHIQFLVLCGEDTQQAIGHLLGSRFKVCLKAASMIAGGRLVAYTWGA